MSPHAELTAAHMQIMASVAQHMPSFFLGMVREDDAPELKTKLGLANQETEDLIALGFLRDISASAPDVLEAFEKGSGRKCRMFHVTKFGLDFFKSSVAPFQN